MITVLDLLRAGSVNTRPELSRRSGLGRTVITQRVAQLAERGLVEEGALGPSTGGRAPRELKFRRQAGYVLGAELGATSVAVGLADLSGRLVAHREDPANIAAGPEQALAQVERLFDGLLANGEVRVGSIWGIGIGLPGPVEFATGRPSAPPIMPGWSDYPVRERFQARYQVPVWVDNEVNTMALGELRAGEGQGQRDLLYVKVGTGIGAGLISGGLLHRGANGCAGDIGHTAVVDDAGVICRCGNTGCLEALAGGAALGRDGTAAAREGRSRHLTNLLDTREELTAEDVAAAAHRGDRTAVELIIRAGHLIGNTLATLVSFYNPSLVLIGGGVTNAGDFFLAAIQETVYRRSLPLATRDLRIAHSISNDRAGLIGAALMVVDELFSKQRLVRWINLGSPVGQPELATVGPSS